MWVCYMRCLERFGFTMQGQLEAVLNQALAVRRQSGREGKGAMAEVGEGEEFGRFKDDLLSQLWSINSGYREVTGEGLGKDNIGGGTLAGVVDSPSYPHIASNTGAAHDARAEASLLLCLLPLRRHGRCSRWQLPTRVPSRRPRPSALTMRRPPSCLPTSRRAGSAGGTLRPSQEGYMSFQA